MSLLWLVCAAFDKLLNTEFLLSYFKSLRLTTGRGLSFILIAKMQRFITVEGGDGVGKSSFCAGLLDALVARSIAVVSTREPGGTKIADQIRQIFMSPPNGETLLPETELCLVSAGRMQHVTHLVAPSLEQGKWVLCDRFADSSRVYQGEIGGVSSEIVENFISATTRGLQPDLTFLLDCSTEVAQQRLQIRGQMAGEISRFDSAKLTQHQRIRAGFLQVAGRFPKRFEIIDATESVAKSVEYAILCMNKRGWFG